MTLKTNATHTHTQPQQTNNQQPNSAELPDLDEEDAPQVQVKYEFNMRNADPPGSQPLRFQLAATPCFRTRDQNSVNHGPFVRALGLGGKESLDYSLDPRYARLGRFGDDYVQFGLRRLEAVAVGAAAAELRFCPGDRSHFELLPREGFTDAVAFHAGPLAPGTEAYWHQYACLGAGRVALPKKLAPGEEWRAEFVVRRHERYWDPPVWERRAAQPPPLWVPPAGGDDGGDGDDLVFEAGAAPLAAAAEAAAASGASWVASD